MKFGLEKEYFVLRDDEPIVVPRGLNSDESGVLAEARGLAQYSIVDAVYSLLASEHRLLARAKTLNVELRDEPIMRISRKTRIKSRRQYEKGLTKYQNLYGYEHHRNRISEQTAGVHVSFTMPKSIACNNSACSIRTYNAMFDFVQLFRKLDKAFAEEIKQSKRRPGFYEIKPDGRIEYRSLPANVDLHKLIDVLEGV